MRRLLGGLAVAGLMLFAHPAERAQAVPLINPAAATITEALSDHLTVEVRYRGGFRGDFRGGRHFGRRHAFHRPHFHRPHFHRRHFAHRRIWRPRPVIYPHYYYAQPCRRVWTDFGPRRVCRHRPWWI